MYFVKLFNGGNNAALSYHASTRYKILISPPFQNILDPLPDNLDSMDGFMINITTG